LYFLRSNRVHNPNGKSISLADFPQLTAKCRGAYLAPLGNTTHRVLSIRVHNRNDRLIISAVLHSPRQEVALHFRMDAPVVGHCPFLTRFLRPIRVHKPNGVSICSAIFADDCRVPYILQWDGTSSSKLSLPMGDLDTI